METTLDIKPQIKSPTRQPFPHRATPGRDKQPSFTSMSDNKLSRDFRKDRETLKRQHELEIRNLDLQEENARVKEEVRILRAERPFVKLESAGDVKPDVSHLRHERPSATPRTSGRDSDSDDDVVFLREVKAGDYKPVVSGLDRAENTLNRGPGTSHAPKEINRQLVAETLSLLTTDAAQRASTSNQSHREPDTVPRSVAKTLQRSSLTSESDSDDSDDTIRQLRTFASKRKTADRHHRHVAAAKGRRAGSARAGNFEGSRRRPGAPPMQRGKSENDPDLDDEEEGKSGSSSSAGGDYTGPYFGPHLDILSVEAVYSRLDRSFRKYRMTLQYLREWAAWWPRTKVAKYHRLDSGGIWLLAVGIHKWWSELIAQLHSPDCEWPEGLKDSEKEDITLKVEEIPCVKRNNMVRANRQMLEDGSTVDEDAVIDLRLRR